MVRACHGSSNEFWMINIEPGVWACYWVAVSDAKEGSIHGRRSINVHRQVGIDYSARRVERGNPRPSKRQQLEGMGTLGITNSRKWRQSVS